MASRRAERPKGSVGQRRSTTRRRRASMRAVAGSTWLRVVLSSGLLFGIGAAGTFAHWTDAVTVSGVTFTAGTIDLKVNNLDTVASYTTLNISNMVPGNSVAGVLTIKNSGTAPLKYTATSSGTNADSKDLRSGLTVKVTGDSSVTGSSPSATCAGSALSGTGASSVNSQFITTGRLLASNGTETICLQVTLPSTAASSLQGATTNVTLTFTGTSDLT
jgi:predicted ribosomally synthesized peptide with SipW-like signal peptide